MNIITDFEKQEWNRFADALEASKANINGMAGFVRTAANCDSLSTGTFDAVAKPYRQWLVFGTITINGRDVAL